MKELYVVNCCRTAIGSFGGSLKNHSRCRDGRHRGEGSAEPRRREARAGGRGHVRLHPDRRPQGQNVARRSPSRPASPIPFPPIPWAWSAVPA